MTYRARCEGRRVRAEVRFERKWGWMFERIAKLMPAARAQFAYELSVNAPFIGRLGKQDVIKRVIGL